MHNIPLSLRYLLAFLALAVLPFACTEEDEERLKPYLEGKKITIYDTVKVYDTVTVTNTRDSIIYVMRDSLITRDSVVVRDSVIVRDSVVTITIYDTVTVIKQLDLSLLYKTWDAIKDEGCTDWEYDDCPDVRYERGGKFYYGITRTRGETKICDERYYGHTFTIEGDVIKMSWEEGQFEQQIIELTKDKLVIRTDANPDCGTATITYKAVP